MGLVANGEVVGQGWRGGVSDLDERVGEGKDGRTSIVL